MPVDQSMATMAHTLAHLFFDIFGTRLVDMQCHDCSFQNKFLAEMKLWGSAWRETSLFWSNSLMESWAVIRLVACCTRPSRPLHLKMPATSCSTRAISSDTPFDACRTPGRMHRRSSRMLLASTWWFLCFFMILYCVCFCFGMDRCGGVCRDDNDDKWWINCVLCCAGDWKCSGWRAPWSTLNS